MRLHLVTCADWNYRRWTTTLINSLDNSWAEKFVVAVGEGDWQEYGKDLGVTIIHQPWNHKMDMVRWCQNVRMRHMRALLDDCDYLLQIDSDMRQHNPFEIEKFQDETNKDFIFWCNTKDGKMRPITPGAKKRKFGKLDPRFHINAGWCLYKNCKENRIKLGAIQEQFDHSYNDEPNWDQIQLFHHYRDIKKKLPWQYVDDGSHGGFGEKSDWYHCKGPEKKKYTWQWHQLDCVPVAR
tara:strand:- start:616 stop:1329 length:714 start_codon:yes stop_codon:yes gene_type:complete